MVLNNRVFDFSKKFLCLYALVFGLAMHSSANAQNPASNVQTSKPTDSREEIKVIGSQTSYFEKSRDTAFKYLAENLETPFSTNIINGALLEDLKANTLEEAYNYVPGFSRSGTNANSFTIRGLSSDLANVQVDGLPGNVSRFGSPVTANIERVEILKGPASVLYGLMDPGGLVNIVTKKANADSQSSLDLTAQYYSDQSEFGVEGSIDIGGALNASESWAYRLIAGGESQDSFRNFVESDSIYVFPSFSWVPNADTRLDIQLEYLKEDRSGDNGLFVANQDISTLAPIETYYQEPGDFDNDEGYGFSLTYQQNISESLAAKLRWRSVWHEDERNLYESNSVINVDATEPISETSIRRRNRHQLNERDYHFLDANLHWQLGDQVTHDIILGFNGGHEFRRFDRLAFDTRGANLLIYDPVYTGDILEDDPGSFRSWDFYTAGFYASDKITFNDRFSTIFGLRWDYHTGDFEQFFLDQPDRTTADESVSDVVFKGGLVYRVTPAVSIYAGYSESFNPQTVPTFDINDEQLDPETGQQSEVGLKYESGNGRVNINVAYFDLVKDNITEVGPSGFDERIGEISSQGIEFNLQMQPTDNFQFQLGYAYVDAEISDAFEDAADTLGNPPGFSPEHSIFALTRYNYPKEVWGGLVGTSLGIKYEDERFTDEETSRRVLLPSYTTVDLAMYYEVENIKYAFNVRNLTNEEFHVGGTNDSRIYPGEPITLAFSVRYNW